MNPKDARKAANAWVDARAMTDTTKICDLLTKAMSALIPDDPGGIALTREKPPRLAIVAGSNLFLVNASKRDEDNPLVTCDCVPLLRERVRMQVTQELLPDGAATFHRVWQLKVDGDDEQVVSIEGLARVTGIDEAVVIDDDDVIDGERLGHALARGLGWGCTDEGVSGHAGDTVPIQARP